MALVSKGQGLDLLQVQQLSDQGLLCKCQGQSLLLAEGIGLYLIDSNIDDKL